MYPMHHKRATTTLVIIAFLCGLLDRAYGDIIILSPLRPDNSSYPAIIARPVEYSTTDFNITGQIVLVNGSGCNGFDFDATGLIILVTTANGCSFGRRLVHAKEVNALAVILYSYEPEPGRDVRMPPEDESGPFTIPGVYIAPLDSFLNQLALNSTTLIQLTPSSNPWADFYNSAGSYVYQAVFLAVFAALLGIGIWKLVEATRANGFQFTILQAFILIEILNNIMRLVYFVDPFRSRGLYIYPASFILETLHIPITFVGSMLITLYWLETVSDYISSKPSAKWLGKMQAPFYVFLGLVVGLFAVFLGLGYVGNPSYLTVLIIVWILFGMSAAFLVGVGAKVLAFARKMSSSLGKNTSRNSAVKLMTVKIIFVALGMILILALYPAVLTNARWTPLERQLAANIVVFSTLAIVSTAQLLTIQRKRPSKSWKTSSSAGKTSNTQQTPTAAEEPLPTV